MTYVWSGIIIISFIFAFFGGNVQETLTAGLDGAASAVTVLLSFAGIMCFWSGMLKIAEESGAARVCEKLLSPAVRRLFPRLEDRRNISVNITANLLGMGNAATPAGISAMRDLDAENGSRPRPSREMCRFVLLNTASLQLFPTTVIGILASSGSENPFSIVPAIWISSLISLFAALAAECVLSVRRDKK